MVIDAVSTTELAGMLALAPSLLPPIPMTYEARVEAMVRDSIASGARTVHVAATAVMVATYLRSE